MKEFAGRVAVVTGAASGMGLAFCHRFADEGMKVVLADIEAEPMAMAEAALSAKGIETLSVRTNVMVEDDLKRLADAAFAKFGNVHVLCNNAGVIAGAANLRSRPWESSLQEWEWTWGVNFMGVLHGVRAFVPRMLENGEDGHIVNTASMAGLLTGANAYHVSKHAVVCLTEGIYKEFRTMGAKLSASALCPGVVNTAIFESERNRPQEFGSPVDRAALPADVREWSAQFEEAAKEALDPADVAREVLEAIRDDRFYIFPAPSTVKDLVNLRMNDIIEQCNPTMPSVG